MAQNSILIRNVGYASDVEWFPSLACISKTQIFNEIKCFESFLYILLYFMLYNIHLFLDNSEIFPYFILVVWGKL